MSASLLRGNAIAGLGKGRLRVRRRRPVRRVGRHGRRPRRRLATLPAGSLLLGRGAALGARAPRRARVRLLAASARGAWRVGNPGRPLLRHAFVLQRFVLLLVLDACPLSRHMSTPFRRYERSFPPRRRFTHVLRRSNLRLTATAEGAAMKLTSLLATAAVT